MIRYLDEIAEGEVKIEFQAITPPHAHLQQTASGYGSKLNTWKWAKFTVDGIQYSRRVYATCYSNVASLWVIFKKERWYLR